MYHANEDDKIIAYHRWKSGGPGDSVVVVANFSSAPRENYAIGLPAAGEWIVRFNSDSKDYNEEFGGIGNSSIHAETSEKDGLSAQAQVSVAPYSAIILSQNRL